MSLRPCPACRRHVAATTSACVFCAASLPEAPARLQELPGRFARAAVFAGATLASACVVVPDPPAQAPATVAGPPGGGPSGDGTVTGPPGGGFAQPPPGGGAMGGDPVSAPPVAQIGGLELVVHTAEQQPVVRANLQLIAPGGARQDLVTGDNGVVRVDGLAVGEYQIVLWAPNPSNRRLSAGPPQKRVVPVGPGATTRVVFVEGANGLQVAPDPDYDRRHMAKPYGAPPARRRVV